MKLAKSLLLGSAAGLMAVAGANAADLPVRAAAPAVDYVRVCNAYGTGFFFIPGTETCLRVSGSIRVDVDTNQRREGVPSARHNNFLIGGRSQISFDSRTATEMGLLRTLVTFDANHASPGTDTTYRLPNAYIQWGGLTAGRVSSSAFDYYTEATFSGIRGGAASSFYAGTNAFWYTAAFGQGVSATIALEQNDARRAGWGGLAAARKWPEIIANLRVTQAWGGAQIALAAHHLNPSVGGVNYDRWGWAAMAGVNVNLPMLAPGSQMWLQGAYADGAVAYTGTTGITTRRISTAGLSDAYVVGPANSLRTTKSWAVAAGLRHNWTPQWQSNLHVSTGNVRIPVGAFASYRGFDWWNVQANTIWRPVSGLLIGLEGGYTQQRRRIAAPAVRADSTWAAKLRIQRDF